MKVTYASLKEYTAALEARGDTEGALKGCMAALTADPADLDIRSILVRLLLARGHRSQAIDVLRASAYLAIRANHPATAMAFIKRLEILGEPTRELWNEMVVRYSADSTLLSDMAPRLAPLPDDTPVDPPAEELDLDALVNAAIDPSRWPAMPQRHLKMVFLSELKERDFMQLAEIIEVSSKASGQFIIQEGHVGDRFYILATGRVMVTRLRDGKQHVLLRLNPGALFGEMAIVHEGIRTASVIAEHPSLLLEFPARAIKVLASRSPSFADALAGFTQRRMLDNLMNTSPIFRPFTREQRTELLRRFIPFKADRGKVIIEEGSDGHGLYLILTGKMAVIKDLGKSTEKMIAELGPSDVFGEISLIKDSPATASVVAIDSGTLLFLPKATFIKLVEVVPQLKSYFDRLSEERLQELESSDSELEEEIILI